MRTKGHDPVALVQVPLIGGPNDGQMLRLDGVAPATWTVRLRVWLRKKGAAEDHLESDTHYVYVLREAGSLRHNPKYKGAKVLYLYEPLSRTA